MLYTRNTDGMRTDTVYCFEVAKDVHQQDFPWDDQGVEQLKAWLQERYEHYTREGSL